MSRLFVACAAFALTIAHFVNEQVSATETGPKSERIFDPETLNNMPRASEVRRISVVGVLRIYAQSDGPHLFQDLQAYSGKGQPEHMITVAGSAHITSFAERYEAAEVVITGNYRKSACREPAAACPHMVGELEPVSIGVRSYPDKSTIERQTEAGQRSLRSIATTDPDWSEIVVLAERLVSATRKRDMTALRALIRPKSNDPNAATDEKGLDETLAPGARVLWRLFDPESAFVTEQNARPAFRAYETQEKTFSDELRTVAICFDKEIRRSQDWPDSEFDLDTENLGDPFACVRAYKVARGWTLVI